MAYFDTFGANNSPQYLFHSARWQQAIFVGSSALEQQPIRLFHHLVGQPYKMFTIFTE